MERSGIMAEKPGRKETKLRHRTCLIYRRLYFGK